MKSGLICFLNTRKKADEIFLPTIILHTLFLLYYATFPHRHCEGIYSRLIELLLSSHTL